MSLFTAVNVYELLHGQNIMYRRSSCGFVPLHFLGVRTAAAAMRSTLSLSFFWRICHCNNRTSEGVIIRRPHATRLMFFFLFPLDATDSIGRTTYTPHVLNLRRDCLLNSSTRALDDRSTIYKYADVVGRIKTKQLRISFLELIQNLKNKKGLEKQRKDVNLSLMMINEGAIRTSNCNPIFTCNNLWPFNEELGDVPPSSYFSILIFLENLSCGQLRSSNSQVSACLSTTSFDQT